MYVSQRNLFFDTPEPDNKIVMNLLSGSMDLLDAEMSEFLNKIQRLGNVEPTDDNLPMLTECLAKGYVLEKKADEDSRIAALSKAWEESLKHQVESITIYPTFTCNLACTYCFEDRNLKATSDLMSPEMLNAMLRAIDVIHEAHGSSASPMVTIFGGEPLLRRRRQMEIIEQLLSALRTRGFHVGIITNGVELPYFVDVLAKYGVEIVEVTIDGPKEVHDQRRIFRDGRGSFDRVVAGIDALLRKKLHTVVRVNVDGKNIAYLPTLADYIQEKGWLADNVEVDLYPIDVAGSECSMGCDLAGPELLASVFDMYSRHEKTHIFKLVHKTARFFDHVLLYGTLPAPQVNYCGATAGAKYSFDMLGKIFPCCCMNCCNLSAFNQGEFYPEFKLDDKTIELWRSRTVLNLPACVECPEAFLCGSGCTRIALMTGERLEEGVFCPLIREEFQAALNHHYPKLKARIASQLGIARVQ